jgi:Ca2+-binding RTX toxin-like protein
MMKKILNQMLVAAAASLVLHLGWAPTALADCFLQPVTTAGCLVNGKAKKDCLGTSARDEIVCNMPSGCVIEGKGGDDRLVGSTTNGARNVICGGSGNDTLTGGPGEDKMDGELGDDSLSGKAGNDLLRGDYGDDTLDGGDGVDTLEGGEGDDTLYGMNGADLLLDGGNGNDTIDAGANSAVQCSAADLDDTTLNCP